MSRREEITVTCPKCGTEHPFVIWSSINTTLNPDMKAAVKDLSAFQFECPSCGEKTYVDYGCLYHQMEDRIMIQYANSDKSAEQCYEMMTRDGPTGILQDMRKNGYLLRIVRSQRELLEKIAVFDAGLDDRIIEICKVFILAAFHEGNPDCGEIETLYFRDDDKNFGSSTITVEKRIEK